MAGIDQLRAGLVYEYPVDALVIVAKFQARREVARALGELLVAALARQSPCALSADIVVPVPLHPARLGSRGYNQALEIARPVAAALNLPLLKRLCRRSRNTAAQSALPGCDRRKNLAAAFRVRGSAAGTRVLIVDDVVTTGHTLSSLALSLRCAGAAQVTACCAARVVPDQARLKM
ncbi:MAG: ComF family protein [Gammaproteobacteria bacterium]